MRKARNRFERSIQIHKWLQDGWPVGRKVKLKWVKEIKEGKLQCWGETYRDGRHLVIELSIRKCRTWEGVASTMHHEWVHAILWGPASIEHSCEHHPSHFYTLEGEIVNAWNYEGGAEKSKEYPFE